MASFKDKVVLITGASSGLGAETALHFAAAGADLSLTGRNEERLKEVAAKCVERGCNEDRMLVIPADLNTEDDVSKIMKLTIKRFNSLHVLINNAGFYAPAPMSSDSFVEIYDDIMRVNIRSAVQLTKLATPFLIQSRGCIVNMSSIFGIRCYQGYHAIPYSISKAVMDQFTRNLALDLGPKGVRVNGVSPGIIATPPVNRIFAAGTPEQLEAIKKEYPVGRIGESNEVAAVIVFLASDAASFMNGAIVPIDGGWSAVCPGPLIPL